jgi:protein TonB
MAALSPITHPDSQVSAMDRLAFTLLLAVVVHFLLWAGLEVEWPNTEPAERKVVSTLHVTLVRKPAEVVTEPVKHAAEQDQQGSGQTDLEQEPQQARREPAPKTRKEVQQPVEKPVQQAEVKPLKTSEPVKQAIKQIEPVKTPVAKSQEPKLSEPKQIIVAESAKKVAQSEPEKVTETKRVKPKEIVATEPLKAKNPVKSERVKPEPTPVEVPLNTHISMEGIVDMARLNAEAEALAEQFSKQSEQYAKRPKIRTISTLTAKASDDAFYLRQWQEKIERVGNLNYPERIRDEKLAGRLRLLVSLNVDGSVKDIQVLQSSGHKVLDQAAINIVQLAAPFAPFPRSIRERTDILEIIRTWQFGDGSSFGDAG